MPRQKTSPSDYPHAVLSQIEALAQNIVIARKRRGESQAQWAQKLGISQPTMARIERGDPAVAMASYVMCIWLVNPAAGLADLIAPVHDHAALEREVARVRARRQPADNVKKAGESAPSVSAQETPASKPARPATAVVMPTPTPRRQPPKPFAASLQKAVRSGPASSPVASVQGDMFAALADAGRADSATFPLPKAKARKAKALENLNLSLSGFPPESMV